MYVSTCIVFMKWKKMKWTDSGTLYISEVVEETSTNLCEELFLCLLQLKEKEFQDLQRQKKSPTNSFAKYRST